MDSAATEDVVVRQYRFLLRTAPADAMEAAHVEALASLSEDHRAAVLRSVQVGLVAGLRLSPDRVRDLAHLITLGERRAPGAFLNAMSPEVLRRLADVVVLTEAAFALFSGYAAWDGADPSSPEEGWADGGYGEQWHDALTARVFYRDFVGGPSSPDSSFGGH
jgi:hypothetical protein